ncbi:hypothetical protein SNEBB_006427 [Seison nebaliae]|nr:hypothetical protein SNEBB_006427 [Seison nebaliae]
MNYYPYQYDLKNNNIIPSRPSTVTKRKVQSTKLPRDKFLPLISLNKDQTILSKRSSFTYAAQFRIRQRSMGVISNSNIKLPKLHHKKLENMKNPKVSSFINCEQRRPIPIRNYKKKSDENLNEWDAYWSWKSSKLSISKKKYDEELFSNRSSSGYSSNTSNNLIDEL